MVRRLLSGLFLLLGSVPLVATGLAQLNDPTPPQFGTPDESAASFRATQTIKGLISGIHHDAKSLSVVDEEDGESRAFFFISKPKIKAKGSVKKALGKKRVEWTDLQDGYRVKITFVENTREIHEIRALEIKKQE